MPNGNATDWGKILGVDRMVVELKRKGWTTEDVREHVRFFKTEGAEELNRMAGGKLSEGNPLYAVLKEVTALRCVVEMAGGFSEPERKKVLVEDEETI